MGYPLCRCTSPARSDRGGGCTQGGVPPIGVPPSQAQQGGTQGGVPPVGVPLWLGYPPARSGRYPPPTGPGWGTPPPGVDRQKDRHESKHNLPVVLRTRSVIISGMYKENRNLLCNPVADAHYCSECHPSSVASLPFVVD